MKLIDLKTLSKETSISIYTLRKFIKMDLPHYRVGRKILVNPDEFESWFDKFKSFSKSPENELSQIVESTLADLGIRAP